MNYLRQHAPNFRGISLDDFNALSAELKRQRYDPLQDLQDLQNRVQDEENIFDIKVNTKSHLIPIKLQKRILLNAGVDDVMNLTAASKPSVSEVLSAVVLRTKALYLAEAPVAEQLATIQLEESGDTFKIFAKLIGTDLSDIYTILAPTDATFRSLFKFLHVTEEEFLKHDVQSIVKNHLLSSEDLIVPEPFVKRASSTSPSGIKIENSVVFDDDLYLSTPTHRIRLYGFGGILMTQEQNDDLKKSLLGRSRPNPTPNPTPKIATAITLSELIKSIFGKLTELGKLAEYEPGKFTDLLEHLQIEKRMSNWTIDEQEVISALPEKFAAAVKINPDFNPQAVLSNVIDFYEGRLQPVPLSAFKIESVGEAPAPAILPVFPERDGEHGQVAQIGDPPKMEQMGGDCSDWQLVVTKLGEQWNKLVDQRNDVRIFAPQNEALREFLSRGKLGLEDLGLDFVQEHVIYTQKLPRDAKGILVKNLKGRELRLTPTMIDGHHYELFDGSGGVHDGTFYRLFGVLSPVIAAPKSESAMQKLRLKSMQKTSVLME